METLVKTMKFRPAELGDITKGLLHEIGKMHLEYFKRSKDASLTVPQVFDVINAAVTKPVNFSFWILLNESDKLAGFAITEILPGTFGPELHISQAYIAPGHRQAETQRLTIKGFEQFAKANGCNFLTSCTRREPQKAYERWMGRVGFKKRWVVMEKDLRVRGD